MTLAIDAGNSRLKAAVFEGDELRVRAAMPTSEALDSSAIGDMLSRVLVQAGPVCRAVVVCVVPAIAPDLVEVARQLTGRQPTLVNAATSAGLTVAVDAPERLGADRLAAAVAAVHLAGAPVIVVDVGTAMTVTVVDADRRLLGGAIGIGPSTAAEALAQRTGLLPLVNFTGASGILGRDTVAAIQSGLYYGSAGALRELVRGFRRVVGADAGVVLTGGSAALLRRRWPRGCMYAPDLVLDGARLIGEACA